GRIRLQRERRAIMLVGILKPRRGARPWRPRRRSGWRCIDRLQLPQALGLAHCGLRLRQRLTITLEPAVDRRVFDVHRRASHRRLVARPYFHVKRARIETNRLGTARLGHRRPDRPREIERRSVNSAERRGNQMFPPTLGDAGLPRENCREILISDRGWRKRRAERAEPEWPKGKGPKRSGTRRNHYPSRTRRDTTHPHFSKHRRSGSNATHPSIVELTLQRR